MSADISIVPANGFETSVVEREIASILPFQKLPGSERSYKLNGDCRESFMVVTVAIKFLFSSHGLLKANDADHALLIVSAGAAAYVLVWDMSAQRCDVTVYHRDVVGADVQTLYSFSA